MQTVTVHLLTGEILPCVGLSTQAGQTLTMAINNGWRPTVGGAVYVPATSAEPRYVNAAHITSYTVT